MTDSDYQTQIIRLRAAYDQIQEKIPIEGIQSMKSVQELAAQMSLLRRLYSGLPPATPRHLTIPAIFGRSYDENFISDFLAYALHPGKNGLGIAPLEAIFLEFLNTEVDFEPDRIEIRREHVIDDGRLDLLITQDGQPILVIENKIFSSENAHQTEKYLGSINRHYKNGHKCQFIYLTRSGSAPKSAFTPVSYTQLYAVLSSIQFDWSKDIRKSVLWQEFLIHIKEYLTMGKATFQLSEKAKLYFTNYAMIADLQEASKSDWPGIIDALRSLMVERMSKEKDTEQWQFNFKDTNAWQQVYKKQWGSIPGLHVHYEFHLYPGCFKNNSFYFSVDVENSGNNGPVTKFYEQFFQSHPQLIDTFNSKEISYSTTKKKNSPWLASKLYKFTPDFSKMEGEFVKALDDFLFLTTPIDETIEALKVIKP